MSSSRTIQLPDAYVASRSNSSPSYSNFIVIPPARPAMNVPVDIPNRSDSDAFRRRYYQSLAAGARRHSVYPPAKANPSNEPVSSKQSDSDPYGSRCFSMLSKSAPVEAGIHVQRSAPINIPTQRQSARGWAYAYARNSNYDQFVSDEVRKFDSNNDMFENDLDQFNQSKAAADDDDDDDDLHESVSHSKKLSTGLYSNHFPLTHSVDFEL